MDPAAEKDESLYLQFIPRTGANGAKAEDLRLKEVTVNGKPLDMSSGNKGIFPLEPGIRQVKVTMPTTDTPLLGTEKTLPVKQFTLAASTLDKGMQLVHGTGFLHPKRVISPNRQAFRITSGNTLSFTFSMKPPLFNEQILGVSYQHVGTPEVPAQFNKATLDGVETAIPALGQGREAWFPIKDTQKSVKLAVPTTTFYSGAQRKLNILLHGRGDGETDSDTVSYSTTSVVVDPAQLSIKSITEATAENGSPLEFTIEPTVDVPGGVDFFLKVALDKGTEVNDIDWSKAELKNKEGDRLLLGDITGNGKTLTFTGPVSSPITLTLPTKQFSSFDSKTLTLSVNGITAKGTIDPTYLIITELTGGEAIYGGNAQFTGKVDRAPKPGEPLFFRIADEPAVTRELDLANATLIGSHGVGQRIDLSDRNGKAHNAVGQTFTLTIPVRLPEQLPEQDKTFTLSVNGGGQYNEKGAEKAPMTLKKIVPVVSIEKKGGNLNGYMGKEDISQHYQVRWSLDNIALKEGSDAQRIQARRQLSQLGNIALVIEGIPGKESIQTEGDSTACRLTIMEGYNNTPTGLHIKLPSYIEFTQRNGSVSKKYHGCRPENAIDLAGALWLPIDDSKANYSGQLDVRLGFEMNNEGSMVTLETPQQTWFGKAEAEGTITVRAEWNVSQP
ncbi:MAG: hypothetical protein ACRC5A_07485 [Enterobacteriaceae bacterium]